MRYFQRILSIVAAALAMSMAPGSAATLNVDLSGQLLGASGVDVNGTLYDVAFLDGTCFALYNGCNEAADFTFTTEAATTAASQALLRQVFNDGSEGQFDSTPSLTFGIMQGLGDIITPYQLAGLGVDVVASRNSNTETSDITFKSQFQITLNLTSFPTMAWARWAVSPSPVPLPAGGLLLLSGLGAIVAFRRRKKHTA